MAGTGRIPPHNEEAEKATLGAILLDNDAVGQVYTCLRPEDFYSNANRRVYEAGLGLYNRGLKADLITVTEELRQHGDLDAAGGPAYIAALTNQVPSSANVDYYARLVQDGSLRRGLIRVAGDMGSRSFDEAEESRLVLEESQQKLFDLSEDRKAFSYKKVGELITPAVDLIEQRVNSKDPYTGIPAGFGELDSMTTGFQNSELIIIGARPSVGKTALALTMAANVSIRNKRPAAFFSLEMSDMALMQRLISSEAMIDANKLRTGFLKNSEIAGIMDAAGNLYDAPLFIVDTPNMQLLDLRTQARMLRVQQKVEIIFIDYLSLISSDNFKMPRYEQIAEVSRSLKSLARELGIPIVVLSQLRRDAEGKKPSLADIRESGSIEQDADVVIFLHRDRGIDKKPDETSPDGIETELIVAKQRNGPVGTVKILFLPRFAKYVNLAREQPVGKG